MKQTRDEAKFIPFSIEEGKARQIQKIVIAYSLLSNMESANTSRHFLFSNEGQGYKNAYSYSHNRARFPCSKTLIPPREREQAEQKIRKEKNAERRSAILGLKYGRRYGTITTATIERAKTAGIKIKKDNSFIFSNAEVKRQFLLLLSSEMKGK